MNGVASDDTEEGSDRTEIKFPVSIPVGFSSVDPAVRKVTFVTVYDQAPCVAECVSLKRSRTFSNCIAVVYGELGSQTTPLFTENDFW